VGEICVDIATAGSSFVPTSEQKKVIRFRSGHLQVIACAGSGKTETMAQRVVELIAENVQPEGIIAFTFTERAAAGLKSRIAQRVSERFGSGLLARLATMYVGTIHAFCLHLLQNHASQYENYDILDENQHAALLSREYRRLKLDKLGPQHWLCSAKTFALGMKPR
jgi:DNA helicase-2/ATP-dependent DNA helicase PcrA